MSCLRHGRRCSLPRVISCSLCPHTSEYGVASGSAQYEPPKGMVCSRRSVRSHPTPKYSLCWRPEKTGPICWDPEQKLGRRPGEEGGVVDLTHPRACSHAEANCLCVFHSSPHSPAAEGPASGAEVPRISWSQTFKMTLTSVNQRLAKLNEN